MDEVFLTYYIVIQSFSFLENIVQTDLSCKKVSLYQT